MKKVDAHRKSAQGMNAKFAMTPMHITFRMGLNPVGVEQHACVGCGDCVTGCNYGAKSTTLMNYLPDAYNHGAEIYTQVCVRHLERKNEKWLVHYQLLNTGLEKFNAPTMFVSADIVVLRRGRWDPPRFCCVRKRRAAAFRPRRLPDDGQRRRPGLRLQLRTDQWHRLWTQHTGRIGNRSDHSMHR